jgi:nucleotide-binding universal stress UspA family protein
VIHRKHVKEFISPASAWHGSGSILQEAIVDTKSHRSSQGAECVFESSLVPFPQAQRINCQQLGVDILILGTPHRGAVVRLLKGNLVTEVAHNLPVNIQLLIYG